MNQPYIYIHPLPFGFPSHSGDYRALNRVPCANTVGEGNGTPLQYSCLQNPMDRGAWQAAVHGVTKSRACLSNFTFAFHFHALENKMATHSNVLAWRTPGWGSLVGCLCRVAQSWVRPRRLSSSSSSSSSSSASTQSFSSPHTVSVYFVAPGGVCPGASIAVKSPRSQAVSQGGGSTGRRSQGPPGQWPVPTHSAKETLVLLSGG